MTDESEPESSRVHVSAVCLHAQALDWNWEAAGKPNWKPQEATETFPLPLHVSRILNNNFCEKYFCYSKIDRKSHLHPQNCSNTLTEVCFPPHSSPITNRGVVWWWHSLWYRILFCVDIYLPCVLLNVWSWIFSRESQGWHQSQTRHCFKTQNIFQKRKEQR